MIVKLAAVADELRGLGDQVRAEELEGRVKAAGRRPAARCGTGSTCTPMAARPSRSAGTGSRSIPSRST